MSAQVLEPRLDAQSFEKVAQALEDRSISQTPKANVVEVERGSREYAGLSFCACCEHFAGNSREAALQALTAKAKEP